MAKTKKKVRAALPQRPPKRTGKRGPRPEDKKQLLTEAARQARLPGMEDSAIEEIEAAAHAYKSTMNRRLSVLRQEVDQGNTLLALMKKHGKKTYRRDGLLVTTVETKEKVRVKVGDAEEIEEYVLKEADQPKPDEPEEEEETDDQEDEGKEESLGNF